MIYLDGITRAGITGAGTAFTAIRGAGSWALARESEIWISSASVLQITDFFFLLDGRIHSLPLYQE